MYHCLHGQFSQPLNDFYLERWHHLLLIRYHQLLSRKSLLVFQVLWQIRLPVWTREFESRTHQILCVLSRSCHTLKRNKIFTQLYTTFPQFSIHTNMLMIERHYYSCIIPHNCRRWPIGGATLATCIIDLSVKTLTAKVIITYQLPLYILTLKSFGFRVLTSNYVISHHGLSFKLFISHLKFKPFVLGFQYQVLLLVPFSLKVGDHIGKRFLCLTVHIINSTLRLVKCLMSRTAISSLGLS